MLAGLAVLSLLAQSDPSDWAAPPESVKPAEPALPSPPVQAEPAPPPPAEAKAPEPEPEVVVPAPDPRRFTWGHAVVGVMGAFGRSGYFAVRIEGGAIYGWPRRIAGSNDHAMGPSIGLTIDLAAAKVRVAQCGLAGVCGSRYEGGLGLRGAWSWGVIGSDGVVAPIHSVFLQAVGFLSSNSVPSAPLAPGNVWDEHGVRFDLGVTSGILRGAIWPKPGSFVIGGGLYFAVSLEWMIIHSDFAGSFRGGVSLGLGI